VIRTDVTSLSDPDRRYFLRRTAHSHVRAVVGGGTERGRRCRGRSRTHQDVGGGHTAGVARVAESSARIAALIVADFDGGTRSGRAWEGCAASASEYSSGATRRIGSITKQGNPYLRELLLEAAHSVLRRADSDNPLNHWAQAVRARRGIQVAAVALARRLAGVLWAMWRDDTVYEPARLGLAGARGLRREAQRLELRREALLGAAKKVQRRVRRTTRLSPPQTANAEVVMK
jgi:hypothetical protein